MKLTDQQIWNLIIKRDWSLDFARRHLANDKTFYAGRPLLFSAAEVFQKKILTFKKNQIILKLDGKTQEISPQQNLSVINSTFAQLEKILDQKSSSDPVNKYLRREFKNYHQLKNKKRYGFYAFYFTRSLSLEAVVQFPELPVYKLALVASSGPLYNNRQQNKSWYEVRRLFNHSHVLVAGASVASRTASSLLRDGRIGYLTIGDPKPPNATNFNRTNYDVFDVATDESKAIAFARQIHRQDPTQIIYLEPKGFSINNFAKYLRPARGVPKVDLVVEAVDNILQKIEILKIAQKNQLPIMQIADVGSKAIISFNNPNDWNSGKSLVLGLNNHKLQKLLEKNFLAAAVYFVGLGNAAEDEVGDFIKTKKGTPFSNTTPQMGSTAGAAAAMATEKILRYLLDKNHSPNFAYRRIVFDKKHNQIRTQSWVDLKSFYLSLVLDLQQILQKKH